MHIFYEYIWKMVYCGTTYKIIVSRICVIARRLCSRVHAFRNTTVFVLFSSQVKFVEQKRSEGL